MKGTDLCFHCNAPVLSGDECSTTTFLVAHQVCEKQYDDDMHEVMQSEHRSHIAEQNSNKRILKKLKRTLKPKIWQAVEWETESHGYGHLEIVTQREVSGERRSGYAYFGEATALRHVYDDVTSDPYGDSYGGDIYLYLGKNRYLKIWIWG